MENQLQSIYDYLRIYAEEKPDMVLFGDEERTYTARKAYDEMVVLGNKMHRFGVKQGSLVALRTTRSLDCSLLLFAIQIMGAVAVLCDGNYKAEDFIRYTGVAIQPEYMITNEESTMDLSANGNWQIVRCATGEKQPLTIGYFSEVEEMEFEPVSDIKALAMVIFTSGSTGKSKGVMISQYNYINHIINYYIVGDYLTHERSFQLLPLHHVFGITQLLNAITRRCSLFFPKNIDVEYILQCIEKYKFSVFGFVPSYALLMADVKKAKGYDTSSLKLVALAGAPITQAQFEYIEETLGLKIAPVYGQSECMGISGAGPYDRADKRASSVGEILHLNKVYILDEKGCELPMGEEGEICVESPVTMLGYYGEEYTPVDENGRLHTGDLGYLDEEGYLHVTGRIKDIIIVNGNNISATRLENKLLSLPFIASAAVVGVKDEKRGEAPFAVVVLKKGQSYDEEAVKVVFNKAERLKEVVIAEDLPLTSSGKIDKQRIKELYC